MIMSRAQSKERPVAPTLSPTAPILLRPPRWTYQDTKLACDDKGRDPVVKIVNCSHLNIIEISCHEKV